MRTRLAEAATGLALVIAGALGVYAFWPKPGVPVEPGEGAIFALSGLGVLLGVIVLIAEALAPPVGLIRGWRGRRTKYPLNAETWTPTTPDAKRVADRLDGRMSQDFPALPSFPPTVQRAEEIAERQRQRATLGQLREEAKRHVALYTAMSLDQLSAAHADEWVDTWTFEVREALSPDAPGLARFDQPIDAVSGQDWRLRPLTMLRVRLTRLEAISADEYWEGPRIEPGLTDLEDP